MAILAITAFAMYSSVATNFNSHVTKIPTASAFPQESGRPTASPTGAENILLLGSDKRGTVDLNQSSVDDQRSDTMMIVHIPADRKSVQVMSVMRDSWVNVPGHGKAKINAALAYGGVPLVVQTVEQLTNARIDHVAMIDFSGFKDMTDALGGITVDVPKAFSENGYSFTQGPNFMNGSQALVFVRARHPFADADYQRVRDQQAFLKAMANRVISQGTLTSPDKIFSFASAVSKHLSVDAGFDFQSMAALGVSLRDVRSGDITYFTMPTSGTGMEGAQSVVYVNEAQLPALKAAFAGDTLAAFAAAQH
ncbi:LCP family protein [Leifsonia sp. AG29]|uniref:LCP family protein n=1 Tax=Leifsonia sp. AG29 TaxID=2598860 RepID=UPI00131ACC80|nr:LCP family protein [Leifsonia sp. AG29]